MEMEDFDKPYISEDEYISEDMRKALLGWRKIEEHQLQEIFEQKSKTIILPAETL